MTRLSREGSVGPFTRTLFAALACAALLAVANAPAAAQETEPGGSDDVPAHIAFVDGAVVLEREGRTDASPASMPLLAGDRLRTQSGRVEVLFADGSTLHLDQDTLVDFQSDEVVRLLEGRIRLTIAGRGRGLAYRIDAPGGWVQIAEAGDYRVAVLRGESVPQVELAVLRGAAELINEDGRSLVRAGERAFARAGAQPSPPYVFNSAAWDAFDRWSEDRRDRRLGISAQYLPPDVRPYTDTFDSYGSWRYETAYGYVWYPRVRADWRPYYHGRWASLRPYGWTWIAHDPWGWPTHHYGRWGYSVGGWFWIPGHRWSAAWVSWADAPGYVSWCPLGWNDRPVFSFFSVNLYGGRHYDRWHGWTVVPRRHFGTGFVNVNVNVVRGDRLDYRTRDSFSIRSSGPDRGNYAVPRASVPIRAAGVRGGNYAVPRGSAGSTYYGGTAPSTRGFPAPARQPRAPGAVSSPGEPRAAPGAPAPITVAPQRAVPRDRAVERPAYRNRDGDNESSPSPSYRSAPRDRGVDSSTIRTPDNQNQTLPSYRAVPRRRPDAPPPTVGPGSAEIGRVPDGSGHVAPQYRRDAPQSRPGYQPGYRVRPDQGDGGQQGGNAYPDTYRAVPRREAPPSYDPPRRDSGQQQGDSPRSFGGFSRPESRPSAGSGDRGGDGGGQSAGRPAGRGSGESGSRSRGGQPSQGQARPRSRG